MQKSAAVFSNLKQRRLSRSPESSCNQSALLSKPFGAMSTKRCYFMRRSAVFALGLLFIAAGVYLFQNWIAIFTRLRGKEMALSPTAPSYAGWKVSPLPLDFDVYLFNWTNPEDFYAGSTIKPRFQQLGPYRFREKPDKVDIEWHKHNDSVSFRKKAAFFFDAEGSSGSLKDRITTVNTVAHSAALRAKGANPFIKNMLQGALRMYHEELTVTKSADEWLFRGYKDPLVTMGGFLSMFTRNIEVPYDRVGWLYTRNDSSTYEGHFNMHTGADDIHKMGAIHTWNDMTHNGRFPGECGKVNGSMGEFFPPNLKVNDSIWIYLPNMCRSVPLDYAEMVEVHGITAFKFASGKRAVDNGTLYPATKCFCVDGKCEAAGVINISPCKYNSSVYMSFPHFYKADPSYLEAIEGLSPVKEKHEFFMSLEPNAGVVMDVGGGFQANYLMEAVEGFSTYAGLKRTFIPIMWCEERVRVTAEIAKEIALVPLFILLGQIATGALLAGGLILSCWYPTKLATRLCKDPKSKSTLLQPLTSNRTIAIAVPPKKPRNGFVDGAPLLEYLNGSIIRPNGTVTEGLLGNTLKTAETNVINR